MCNWHDATRGSVYPFTQRNKPRAQPTMFVLTIWRFHLNKDDTYRAFFFQPSSYPLIEVRFSSFFFPPRKLPSCIRVHCFPVPVCICSFLYLFSLPHSSSRSGHSFNIWKKKPVMCRCLTSSVSLKEERRQSEIKALRRISEPKKEKVTEGQRKLHK